MRVSIDGRALQWAGVGRYIKNMVSNLAGADDGNEYVLLVGKRDLMAAEEIKKRWQSSRGRIVVKTVEGSYYSWLEQTLFVKQLYELKTDLVHFTHFNVPLAYKKPYVVTIHDVTRFHFPGQTQQGWTRQAAYEVVLKHAIERAKEVIFVSEATMNDVKSLPIKAPAEPAVIYEGVDQSFYSAVSENNRQKVRLLVGTKDPYFLYVGVWMEHKNIKRLLTAYKKVAKKNSKLKLVMTGRPKRGYVKVNKLVRDLELSRDQVIYLGQVEQGLLPALYAEAVGLVLISLYEGFGLPAIEAAACGTPVICSNVSSLPEIMEGAAFFVNPEYVPAIVEAMQLMLTDSDLRKKYSQLGRTAAGKYSWRACAEKTLEVYREVLMA